jgi:hypothetical protein
VSPMHAGNRTAANAEVTDFRSESPVLLRNSAV